ncbi:MAG: SAF domain-containing protein [Acidimicrobiales bacterium]
MPVAFPAALDVIPAPAADAPERTIRRRHPLPNGRAVAGGLLVALAAVLTFAAYAHAASSPSGHYVVAARAVAPGEKLTASDLALVAVDVPPSVRHHLFGAVADLTGAAAIAPIAAGALVESSAVGVSTAGFELSLSLERGRAIGGRLRPGEFVDVLGTFGTGSASYTAVMASHVQVLSVSAQSSDTELIVVAAADALAAEAVADAATAASVTLVRASDSGPQPVPPYRAPQEPT